MTKNYSCQTNYIAQYIVKYTTINLKSTASGLGVSFRTIEKTSFIKIAW